MEFLKYLFDVIKGVCEPIVKKVIDSGKTDYYKVCNAFKVVMGFEVPLFIVGLILLINGYAILASLTLSCIGLERAILEREKNICGKMLNKDFITIAISRALIMVCLAFLAYKIISASPSMVFLVITVVYSVLLIVNYKLYTLIENKAKVFETMNKNYTRKIV